MIELSYREILKRNNELQKAGTNTDEKFKILVLSNIIVNPLKDILEYNLRSNGVFADVNFGNYDNIVQDSKDHKRYKMVIIFWEICNLTSGFQYDVELFDSNQMDEIIGKTRSEIDFILNNLKDSPLVLFNLFSTLAFDNPYLKDSNYKTIVSELNQYLKSLRPGNVAFIDIDTVIARSSIEKSFNYRFYYTSKALYSVDFLINYTAAVSPLILSANGKSKKAIVFDCDNTLWKGILGEDGFKNIEMSPSTWAGGVFEEIQKIALQLYKSGILLCICSKNNFDDVEDVLNNHPDMILKKEHFACMKINWKDKYINLIEIAKELNIGLESIVFLDDSDFEINLIENKIPEVTVMQVPKNLSAYPSYFRKSLCLFYNLSSTREDQDRSKMYSETVRRNDAKNNFSTIDEYLESLGIKITVYRNPPDIISRISQMTLKTNQFNLTTKRYTENEIQAIIESSTHEIFAISVADNFGNNGITGLCILKKNRDDNSAAIDTFLLSCRIIGRNVEFVFLDYIAEKMKSENIKTLHATYSRTPKNEQVADFYDKCSFEKVESFNETKKYKLRIEEYKNSDINYITISDTK